MNTPFDPMDHVTSELDLEALRQLVNIARRRNPFRNGNVLVLEVGSWAGMSTLALAQPGVDVHCVDHWKGNPSDRIGEVAKKYGEDEPFQIFCRNMGNRLMRTVFPHRGTSLLYASIWPLKMDMIFIDANHDYESVSADIAAWAPHVETGGILCGHDYDNFFPGVIQAAHEIGVHGVMGRVWWKKV